MSPFGDFVPGDAQRRTADTARRVNWWLVDGWARDAIKAALSLDGYERSLEWNRSRFADGRGMDRNERHTLLTQARQAWFDVFGVCKSALAINQHLIDVGYFQAAKQQLTEHVGARGPTSVRDVWDALFSHPSMGAVASSRGLSREHIERLATEIERRNHVFSLEGEELIVSGDGTSRVVGDPGGKRASRGSIDLLFPMQVREVYDAFLADRLPAHTVVTIERREPQQHPIIDPTEDIATVAIELMESMSAHVDKIQRFGVSVHEGEEPGTALLVTTITLAVLAVGAGATCVIKPGELNEDVCDYVAPVAGVVALVLTAIASGQETQQEQKAVVPVGPYDVRDLFTREEWRLYQEWLQQQGKETKSSKIKPTWPHDIDTSGDPWG